MMKALAELKRDRPVTLAEIPVAMSHSGNWSRLLGRFWSPGEPEGHGTNDADQ